MSGTKSKFLSPSKNVKKYRPKSLYERVKLVKDREVCTDENKDQSLQCDAPPKLHSLSMPTKAKRIRIWVNGDQKCYEFTFNPKDFRTWNSILLHTTNVIKPRFGSIRKLISLRTRLEVNNFDDLDPEDKYIGFGGGSQTKLIPHEYRTPEEFLVFRRNKTGNKLYLGPKHFGNRFLADLEKKKLTVVFTTLNGVMNESPQKVVFNKYDLNNWDLVTNYIGKILGIPEGIGKICTIYGTALKDAHDLQHGYLYVVVPNNSHFIQLDYERLFLDDNIIIKQRIQLLRSIRKRRSMDHLIVPAVKKRKKD